MCREDGCYALTGTKKTKVGMVTVPTLLLFNADFKPRAYCLSSIFLLIEEEILFTRVIRPDVFDTFVDFAFVFHFL